MEETLQQEKKDLEYKNSDEDQGNFFKHLSVLKDVNHSFLFCVLSFGQLGPVLLFFSSFSCS